MPQVRMPVWNTFFLLLMDQDLCVRVNLNLIINYSVGLDFCCGKKK